MWVGPPAYPGIRQGAYLSGEDRSGYARVRILGVSVEECGQL
ncbi:MAG: hypothetical protein QW724_05635 [Nitrososphaerota archaeon]